MFSYRHAFHAGNHADVLKHLTLAATLTHLMRKPGPLMLIDTHAGAGVYRLDGNQAQTSGEAADGIERLAASHSLQGDASNRALVGTVSRDAAIDFDTDPVAAYLDLIARFRATYGSTALYPGSPFLMHAMVGEAGRAGADRLRLYEMHPTDAEALAGNIAQLEAGRQISVQRQDGFDALKALLPPPASGGSRRALALIDPSYEIKSDYAKVAAALQDAMKRFATGVYLVWYPLIARPEAHDLPRRLTTLARQAGRPWLNATLGVGQAPAPSDEPAIAPVGRAPGRLRPPARPLDASGMFIVNPPHTLKATLERALPELVERLGRGRGQRWTVEGGG